MSGIFAYTGTAPGAPLLLQGLRRLPSRHDSAGLVVLGRAGFTRCRRVGSVDTLAEALRQAPLVGTTGLAHTRWASCGPVAEHNAHPHLGAMGRVAVVHNGHIENVEGLRALLADEGIRCRSETDSEVLAHLIELELANAPWRSLGGAVRAALRPVHGTWALAVLATDWPDTLVATRCASPLLVAVGRGAAFAASDAAALTGQADEGHWLEDGELAVLTPRGVQLLDAQEQPVHRAAVPISAASISVAPITVAPITVAPITAASITAASISAAPISASSTTAPPPVAPARVGGVDGLYREIHEQPQRVAAAMDGRLDLANATAVLDGLGLGVHAMRGIDRLVLLGSGASRHAALVGKVQLEALTRLPVEVVPASEFCDRDAPVDRRTLCVGLSPSGASADAVAALAEAAERGAHTLAVVGVEGSRLAQVAQGVLPTRAGSMLGSGFSSEVVSLLLLALAVGRARGLAVEPAQALLAALQALPLLMTETLALEPALEELVAPLQRARSLLLLGCHAHVPVALEGARLLTQRSGVHAEGVPAGELAHGPLALVHALMPAVVLAPHDRYVEQAVAAARQLHERRGLVVAITTQREAGLDGVAQSQLVVPQTHPLLQPVLGVIPLQLLAYRVAVRRGRLPGKTAV